MTSIPVSILITTTGNSRTYFIGYTLLFEIHIRGWPTSNHRSVMYFDTKSIDTYLMGFSRCSPYLHPLIEKCSGITSYPVLCPKLTLMQPTWSAYPYHLVKNQVVSASVTKGELVCFVVTGHWWRHRTHYDVTKTCRALRNILTCWLVGW